MDNECCNGKININMCGCCGSGTAQGAQGGRILWKNNNPMQDFGEQEIILSSEDYDMLEWIYGEPQASIPAAMSNRSIKGYGTYLCVPNVTAASGYIRLQARYAEHLTDLKFLISNCAYLPAINNCTVNNKLAVPLYVIGYKTGLYNSLG